MCVKSRYDKGSDEYGGIQKRFFCPVSGQKEGNREKQDALKLCESTTKALSVFCKRESALLQLIQIGIKIANLMNALTARGQGIVQ